MAKGRIFNLNILRVAALLAVLVGAVGSLGLMFNAGRNQKSVILMALFTIWVLSPFVGIFVADKFSNRWTALTRVSFYCLILVLTIVSLAAYSGAFSSPETKNAFMFLVVPFVSWLFIAAIILIAELISRNRAHNTNDTKGAR